jgi:hypothetical protein
MIRHVHRPRRTRRAAIHALAAFAALVAAAPGATGCRLSPYKFAGGGLPRNVRTIAILPFENQTAVPDLQREVFETMRTTLQRRLNLRDASESRADAIVRGSIVRYDADVPIAFSADPRAANQARRQLQLVVDVTIIDQASGRTLWERKGLSAKGEYAERNEVAGRRQAIEQLVSDVVEGAQSQW